MIEIDLETIVNEIKTCIVDGINAELTTIDTEKADFVIPKLDVTNGIAIWRPNQAVLAYDPHIFVLPIKSKTIDGIHGGRNSEIQIYIEAQTDPIAPERLDVKLCRYVLALERLFKKTEFSFDVSAQFDGVYDGADINSQFQDWAFAVMTLNTSIG